MKKVHYDSLSCYHSLFPSDTLAQKNNYDEYSGAFHIPGSIRLATNQLRLEEMKYQMNRYYACALATNHRRDAKKLTDNPKVWIDDSSVEQRLITPEEVKEMCPIIDTKNILAGIYTARDGHIDPYSLTQALAKRAKMAGAAILQNCRVTKITYDASGRVWVVTGTNTNVAPQPASGEKVETLLSSDATSESVNYEKVEYTTKHVVNCAGLWAHEVMKLVGIENIPLVPIHHQYLITESLPSLIAFPPESGREEIAVMRDLENSYYMRQEKNALLIGPYENSKIMELREDWITRGVPKDFGKQLFPPDIDRLLPYLEAAIKRFPVLKDLGIKVCVHGPIMYTPDVLPLVGPVSHLPNNFWIAAGSGYGIVHAGGIGKYLAEWIINEEPPYDLIECDPDRFDPDKWADKKYVFAKARESYGMNNAIYFPREQRIAGRPTKRCTPLAQYLSKEKGAIMGFNNGWEQALYFLPHKMRRDIRCNDLIAKESQNIKNDQIYHKFHMNPYYGVQSEWFDAMRQEVQDVTNCVGLSDLTPFGKFRISGFRAHDFLDWIFANKLPKVGRTTIAHCIAPQSGNVFSEMTISHLTLNDYLLVTGAGSELHDFRWLSHQAYNYALENNFPKSNVFPIDNQDLCLSNVTDELGCLSIAGPLSKNVMERLTENGKLIDDWKFMENKNFKVGNDMNILGIRLSYTGELGWELYHPINRTMHLYSLIHNIGLPLGITDFGGYATNSLRIEKGFKAWSHEMNMDKNPFQAELTPFIKLDKENDFLGKSTLINLKSQFYKDPDNKVLRFLTVEKLIDSDKASGKVFQVDEIDLEGNESVWHENKCVGYTTSGSYSFAIGKHIAMAYIPLYLCQNDDIVKLNFMGNFYECKIHAKPLVKTVEQLKKQLK
ncbi:dimethylglycine dehydrogenase, mitochondrial-like isoform X2 [Gordionus sp. m RMFG-2023]